MPCCTDAAIRCAALGVAAALSGCTAFQRVAPAKPAVQAPGPLPVLANATTLAIPSAPAAAATPEIKPVGYPSADDEPKRLLRDAETAYARQPSYIARMKRREISPTGKLKPEEVIMVRFREKPWSVHFKWLGDEGKGREIVYVNGQHENKLHVLTAAGDIPLMPGGRRMSFALDSPLVKAASRYPIGEAGIGQSIARYGHLVELAAKPGSGAAVKVLGRMPRPEYPVPLDALECTIPPNVAPEVPQGGKRLYFFDPTTKFPVLTVTTDLAGIQVDYCCFDRFQLDVKLDDADFDPDKLWPVKK
ncbi:MAG: DUF1571 domain-containing protein [Gemmataceae bacterium]